MARDNTDNPTFLLLPEITGNPNPAVPLAAILRFKSDKLVYTIIEVTETERRWRIEFDESHDPSTGLPIIGMRANRPHRFQVIIRDAEGNETRSADVLDFTPPPLPSGLRNFPPLKTTVCKQDQMEPGIILMNVRRRIPGRLFMLSKVQRAFLTRWSLIVALDHEGEVIWYYQSDQRIAGIDRLQNGNLLMLNTEFVTREIDMLGNKVTEWYAAKRPQGEKEGAIPVNIQTMHHQPHELPWGNILVLSGHSREVKDFYTSETDPDAPRKDASVMGDKVVEFSRDGSIIWEWNSFDHLDPYRIGYETIHPYWHVRGFPNHWDWTHGNGTFYDRNEDSILICMRLQDAVIKIERSTGEIRWILGNHNGWPERLRNKLLKPEGELRWPYRMHNPKLTPAGNVLIWDNGTIQATPFDGKPWAAPHEVRSRAVEYEVDEERMTVRQVWSSEDPTGKEKFCSQGMGDVQWMSETGNVLAFYGTCAADRDDMNFDIQDGRHVSEFPMSTRVREFKHTNPPEIVFEVVLADPDEILSWECFGGLKVPSLYPEK